MHIETQFAPGDKVRVTFDDDFTATVREVHVEASEGLTQISYTVILPPEKRGKGRNHTEVWRYHERFLHPLQN